MTPTELQSFLHTHIPATATLGITVQECHHDKVSLAMPHAGNQNHKNTVFGGSIALAATTCGWALTYLNFPEANGNIVIQQGQTRYLRPATGDLILTVRSVSDTDWVMAHDECQRRGKGKILLETEIYSNNKLVAVFAGRYVIFNENP